VLYVSATLFSYLMIYGPKVSPLKSMSTLNAPDAPIEHMIAIGNCPTTGKHIDISYNAFGDKKNPVILMIMGVRCPCVIWDSAMIDPLVAAGYYVIRFDNRDVGFSTKMDGVGNVGLLRLMLPEWAAVWEKLSYRLEDMADDVVRFLDALGIEKAHIVAQSMGGMIAQCLALRNPEKVLSMSLMMTSTGARDIPGPSWKTIFGGFLRRPKSTAEADVTAHRLQYINSYLADEQPLTDTTLATAVTKQIIARGSYPEGFKRQLGAVARQTPRDDQLRAASAAGKFPPTLVIHGVADRLQRIEAGRRLHECITGSRMVELEKMGHYITEDNAAVITKEILLHIEHSMKTSAK
jgi:pimeloyl-ACP methyl ester carboxylesterase